MSRNTVVVILAAGLGTRMKSGLVKVLHLVGGQPMIIYPLSVAERLNPERILVVVGFQGDRIRETCLEFRGIEAKSSLEFVLQEKPLGTGHAMMQVEPHLKGSEGNILVLCGDVPLLREQTLWRLLDKHIETGASISLLTVEVPDPTGYGRIIRDRNGLISRIVEERDAQPQEKQIKEINSGIYCFQADFLFSALKQISCHNRQGEYYLTDVLEIARVSGIKVEALLTDEATEVMGINNRRDMAKAESVLRWRTAERMMLDGVTILHPESTFIDATVEIGRDTILFPHTYLQGQTRIGQRCRILPGSQIIDSILEDEVEVLGYSVITQSRLKQGVKVGPFTHLRPETVLEDGVKVGNFVEIKKSTIGSGSKANHLSYIGDASVGKRVNIGAGTITCNYDGKKKHPTFIEDDVFIGSDTQMVAPVRVGKGSLIGAGTTVTKDVPPYCLTVSRVKQQNLLKRSHVARMKAENFTTKKEGSTE